MPSNLDFFYPDKANVQFSSLLEKKVITSKYFIDLYPYLGSLQTVTIQRKIGSKRIWDCQFINRIIQGLSNAIAHSYMRTITKLTIKNNFLFNEQVLFVMDDIRNFEMQKIIEIAKKIENVSVLYLRGSNCPSLIEQKMPLKKNDSFISLNHNLIRKRDYFLLYLSTIYKFIIDYSNLKQQIPENVTYQFKYLGIMLLISYKKVLWEILRKNLNYSYVINIKHFSGLGGVVSADCYNKNINSVTFQHGVISHFGSSFVPIMAKNIVCFGQHSSNILKEMDRSLFTSTGNKMFCENYYQDDLFALTFREKICCYNKKNLLFIDQETKYASKFYGISNQFKSIHKILSDIVQELEEGETLTVRIHPSSKGISYYNSLKKKYPDRFFISKTNSLKSDLYKSGVVFGLFSGALVEAAASGVATYFIWDENWYISPDFRPFIEKIGPRTKDCKQYILETIRNTNKNEEIAIKSENVTEYYFNKNLSINDLFKSVNEVNLKIQ